MPSPRSPFSRRPARLQPPASHLLDTLEPRRLLTADLAVRFDNFTGAPSTLIPGDRVSLPILIANIGNTAAIGRVSIDFYLSTNATLETSDTLLRTFANQPIQLSADGFPNSVGDFAGTVDIPDIAPGDYFFLVRIRPNSQVDDFNQANNRAASDDPQDFAWKFGNFGGRTNATLTLTDPSGTEVDFSLTGGGSGTVTRDPADDERFNIVLSRTGGASNLAISAFGGEGPTSGIALINDIRGGSLASIDAPTARLLGDIRLTGSLGSLRLFDVAGPSLIRVRGAATPTAYQFGEVADLIIESTAPISSLSVTRWDDTDAGGTDLISAPWLGTLTSAGSFEASMSLSGRSGNSRTLDTVAINGAVGRGAWDIDGRAGSIAVRAGNPDWSLSIRKALSSFTVANNFRGVVAAKSINALDIGVNLRGAKVLAGAYLGDDARLGGSGADADTFTAGNISNVAIGGRVMASIIGAGLDPGDGIFGNGNDSFRGGRISNLAIDRTANPASRFLARRYAGLISINDATIDPAADARFML